MNLKKATLLIIIGLSVSFLLRAASTLHPEIFQSGTAARIISVLLFLSSIAVLVFFAYFFKGNLFPRGFSRQRSAASVFQGMKIHHYLSCMK